MKIKLIAAACLALCSASSFAVTAGVTCDTTNGATFVNTCLTATSTFYVAGSSALAGAITAVVPTDLFDTSKPVYRVKDASTGISGVAGSVSAWAGYAVGTTTPLLVVYNKQNGSAAGISQLLSKPTDFAKVPEFDVVTAGVGSVTKGVAGSCSLHTADTKADVDCTSHAPTQATMGISDVRPIELFALEGTKPAATTTLTVTPVAVQGFGIAVNAKLYNALQAAEGTSGQPSIDASVYASLATHGGAINSATKLLDAVKVTGGTNTADGSTLVLARRDNYSGSQAASNIFFLDNACGTSTLAGKPIKGVLGGDLVPADATDNVTGVLQVNLNATTGQITSATGDLASATNYAIGVLGLNTLDSALPAGAHFIKLNGVSPTFEADGTTASHAQRTRFVTGDYPFAVMSTVAYATKPLSTVNFAGGTKMLAGQVNLIPTLTTALENSLQHDLNGIGYIDGVADTTVVKQSHVIRANGNNCSPLTHL